MDTTIPKRGDIVSYGRIKFYYQPNGSTCYLFKDADDIGKPRMAVYTPTCSAIRFPPDEGSKVPDRNRHRPLGLTTEQREDELALLRSRLELMKRELDD